MQLVLLVVVAVAVVEVVAVAGAVQWRQEIYREAVIFVCSPLERIGGKQLEKTIEE